MKSDAGDAGRGASGLSRREFLARAASVGAAVGVGPWLLAGCGGDGARPPSGATNSNNVSGDITVWTWPDNDKMFAKTVPLFEKAHPDVKVKVEAYSGQNNNYTNKLLAALVAGSGPDVAMVEIGAVALFKSKPGFVDLGKAPYNAGRTRSSYASFAWGYAYDEKRGKLPFLPKNTGPGAMFYRRDALDAAGLPSAPDKLRDKIETWDDLLAAGKEIARPNQRWLTDSGRNIFAALLGQQGMSYFKADGSFDVSRFRPAMQEVEKFARAQLISPFTPWSSQWGAAIAQGQIATMLYGNWLGGNLKSIYDTGGSGRWGVVPAPATNGVSAYNSGGDFLGVLETSAHKDAAWEFIRWVSQDAESLHTMYEANDLYPAWLPVHGAGWMNQSDSYYAGQIANQVFAPVNAAMKPVHPNPNDPVAGLAFQDAIDDLSHGAIGADAALKRVQDEIQSKVHG